MRRETFLDGIRQQLRQAKLPQSADSPPPPLELAPPPARDALVERFVQEAEAVNASVFVADSAEAAVDYLLALFEQVEAIHFLAWDDAQLPIAGLSDTLTARGYVHIRGPLPQEADARAAQQNEMARAQIGVTGALAGIADTGTLVLDAGAGRGRLASLLPPMHVALVSAEALYPTLHHAIRAMPDANRQSSNVTLITGPSRTGDIGGVLTLGVHGPKALHIIVLAAK